MCEVAIVAIQNAELRVEVIGISLNRNGISLKRYAVTFQRYTVSLERYTVSFLGNTDVFVWENKRIS